MKNLLTCKENSSEFLILQSPLEFPFASSEVDFSCLKRLLIALSTYPTIESVFVNLSETKNTSLLCHDFSPTQYTELIALFKDKNLCVDLQVAHSEAADQRTDLNNTIASNRRNRNIAARVDAKSANTAEEEQEIDHSMLPISQRAGKVRSCKLGKHNFRQYLGTEVSTENQVENQYQQQTQLQQEAKQDTQIQAQQENEAAEGDIADTDHYVSQEKYIQDFIYAQIIRNSQGFVIPSVLRELLFDSMKGSQPQALWDLAVSQYLLPNSIRYLSSAAAIEMSMRPYLFCEGVNVDNLPPGFFLAKYANGAQYEQGGYVLCYDAMKQIENKNLSPLTPLLGEPTPSISWAGNLKQFFPKEGLHKYTAQEVDTFCGWANISIESYYSDWIRLGPGDAEVCLPEILFSFMKGLNSALASKIIKQHEWCLKVSSIAINTPASFQPGPETLALFDVLYHEGVEGVCILLDALKLLFDRDPCLYQHFKTSFISNVGGKIKSLMFLMKEENLSIIQKLSDLTHAQKSWWKTLVSQHVNQVGYADLETLYNGFTYFLSQWPRDLPFPQDCPIESTSNMLVSLDRLLVILSKVNVRNTRDQVFHLKDLDFGKEGAWYAARWDHYQFFHPVMQLTGNAANPKQGYKVTYQDLLELRADDFNRTVNNASLAITIFHRFIGCANYIADNYQRYITLTNQLVSLELSCNKGPVTDAVKVQLLPILALATTGHRGRKNFDATAFLSVIQELASSNNMDRLNQVLSCFAREFYTFTVQPNLEEAGALIRLLHENQPSENEDIASDLRCLKSGVSKETLQAFSLWQRNSVHISANRFIAFFKACHQNVDQDSIGVLSKIIATLRNSDADSSDTSSLIKALQDLKQKKPENYRSALRDLSSLDLVSTPQHKLPTVAQLTTVIKDAEQADSPKFVFIAISNALPDCRFDRVSVMTTVFSNLDTQLIESIEAFNKRLVSLNIEPFDMPKLTGSNGRQYFEKRYHNLLTFDLHKPTVMSAIRKEFDISSMVPDFLIKQEVQKKLGQSIEDCLKSVYIVPIARLCAAFPGLNILQTPEFFPVPADFDLDNIENLETYKNCIEPFFQELVRLRTKWGDRFTLDFLLNSPRTMQFSPEQMVDILHVVNCMYPDYMPSCLFSAIFSSNSFVNKEVATRLSAAFIKIIQLGLSVSQKEFLIHLIAASPDLEVDRIVTTLEYVKAEHPATEQWIMNLLLDYFQAKGNVKILDKIYTLLVLFNQKNDPALLLLLKQLQGRIDLYNALFDAVDKIPAEHQQTFLKIIAYTNLLQKRGETLDDTIERENILMNLGCMVLYEAHDLNAFSALFDTSPRLGFQKLRQYVALPPNKREQFIKDYILDPPGLRSEDGKPSGKVLSVQFDLSSVDRCIGQIVDLNRNNPLFYTHREQLMNHMVYVNAVGCTHPLNAPGMDSVEGHLYRKPVMQLSKSELQGLIRHYRSIMSGTFKVTSRETQIVKLEFVAIVREVMYRTTGMFAYSTQVLSLLNTMLHPGSVFSEIPTGEGKGLITALYGVSKWMEGGAVDVCSANMELADRDLTEFSDFFKYLGVSTALMRSYSSHDNYQQDGINYSDVSEMALFQEQIQLDTKSLPNKVSLILDEADFMTLDNTTQFRYATRLSKSQDPYLNANAWVYPIILAFVSPQGTENQFFENKCSREQDIIDLRNFVFNQEIKWKSCFSDKDQIRLNEFKSRFSDFSDDQLDRWIDAAYIASQLIENEDFSIRDATVIRGEQEIQVKVARVRINHRVSSDASFSNGVQQFLHARLNSEKRTLLGSVGYFSIEPEKTYLASMSSKNFIDYYLRGENGKPRGDVLGLTGTIGSKVERAEMRSNYGFKFYRIPPHKKSNRKDCDPVIAKREYKGIWPFVKKETSQEAHFRVIKKRVKGAVQRSQPILLICDGVQSSQALFDYLEKHLSAKEKVLLQLYNGEQDVLESTIIDQANKSGAITISTPMMERGTDIKPENKKQGLYVIGTHIAAERDYRQMIGRTGRNGMIGLSELIISEEEFTQYGHPVPTTHDDALRTIQAIQEKIAQNKAAQRTESQAFSDIENQFFQQYIEICRALKSDVINVFTEVGEDHKTLWKSIQYDAHIKWESFLNKIDDRWNDLLNDALNAADLNPQQDHSSFLETHIKLLIKFANAEWKKTHAAIDCSANTVFQKEYQRRVSAIKDAAEDENNIQIIPSIHIVAAKVVDAHLQEIDANNKPLLLANISIRPLESKRFDSDTVCCDLLGELATEPEALAAFIAELYAIYQIVFHKIPLDQSSTRDVLYELLSVLLNRYHQTFVGSYDGISRGHQLDLQCRLMKAVEKYGAREDKEAMYAVYKTHIQKPVIAQHGRYLQRLMRLMYRMRDRGILEKEADLTMTGVLEKNADDVWSSLHDYTEQKLRAYSATWFKASDRKKALDRMLLELSRMRQDDDQSPIQKVTALLNLVDKYSQEAMDKDQEVDQEKWRTNTLRNKNGSRFQMSLDAIRANAIVAATGLEDKDDNTTKVNFNDRFNILKHQLAVLNDRAKLNHLKKHKIIRQLIADATLKNAISAFGQGNIKYQYRDLIKIREQLDYYKSAFSREFSEKHSDSENAFTRLFYDVYKRILDVELALSHSSQRDVTVNAPEHRLRSDLQSTLQALVNRDYVQYSGIDISAYELQFNLIRVSPDEKALLSSVLYEIQRHICLQHGGHLTIGFAFTNVSYNQQNATLHVTVQFQDTEGSLHKLSIEVNGLCRGSSQVICQWPKEVVIMETLSAQYAALQSAMENLDARSVPNDENRIISPTGSQVANNPYAFFADISPENLALSKERNKKAVDVHQSKHYQTKAGGQTIKV